MGRGNGKKKRGATTLVIGFRALMRLCKERESDKERGVMMQNGLHLGSIRGEGALRKALRKAGAA